MDVGHTIAGFFVIAGSIRARARSAAPIACLTGLLLTGCGTFGTGGTSDVYSDAQTQAMFEGAYSHVQQRYIEPVNTDSLALAGLARLHDIDSHLNVVRRENAVVLLSDNRELGRFPTPDAVDSRGWAEVTAGVLKSSRAASAAAASARPEDLYMAMMSGVVGLLDPYSRYEGAEIAGDHRAARSGFGGVGITIKTENDRTVIVEVLPESPAASSPLAAGDIITHVDGTGIAGLKPEAVVQRLRGPSGTTVVLDILHRDQPRPERVAIVRSHIVPPTVIGRLERGGVALVRLRSFNSQTAIDLEHEIDRLERLHDERLRGLVLDLRNNPGGLLDQAVQIADLFLSYGPVITTRGRHPASNSAFAADTYEIARGVPMAILINGRSASASEMLAAALQDRGRAVIVGSATHGKGSVQNLQRMPNGGELIITWSRMYAPSGYVIDGLGILPNVCTSGAPGGNPIAKLLAVQDALHKQFRDWHRYDRVDLKLAGILRSNCPASDETNEVDEELATQIVLEPRAYRLALSPAIHTNAYREMSASHTTGS
jgi:carboxyl-terminal processing protease